MDKEKMFRSECVKTALHVQSDSDEVDLRAMYFRLECDIVTCSNIFIHESFKILMPSFGPQLYPNLYANPANIHI